MDKLPRHGWLGILLIVVFWILNWSLSGLRTHWGFFPLWLGYCLTVDALTYARKGNSLLTRNKTAYIFLFVLSAPVWWLFEALNDITGYWYYNAREYFNDLEYYFFTTLSFTTVLPAIIGSAELFGTFKVFKTPFHGPKIGGRKSTYYVMFFLGIILLAFTLIKPEHSAAFLWMSIYFIIDPLNFWLGNRTIMDKTKQGDWREVLLLWAGSLLCGFFWEMWNFYSNPKWFYSVPGVDFWHVFEMPLPGYLGYLPFSLEVFVLYQLLIRVIRQNHWKDYIRIAPNS